MKRKSSQRSEIIDLDDDSMVVKNDDSSGMLDDSEIICTYQEDSSFVIDLECVGENEEENSAFVPSEEGSKLNFSVICSNSHITPEVKKTRKGPQCFNCEGSHQLSECKEPRDNRRISRNRSSFRSSMHSGPRIHEQQQQDGEKKEFVPGVISDSLRQALGIGRNDAPEWIFRMRRKGFIEGYPPAYLKRAVEKATLNLFAIGDSEKADGDEYKEVIDPEKMIRYKGFNSYDKRLSDPENFRIPPWSEFVSAHQEILDQRNEERRRSAPPMIRHSDSSRSHPPSVKRLRRSREGSMEEGEIDDDSMLGAGTSTVHNETTMDDSVDRNGDGVSNGTPAGKPSSPMITRGTPILMSNTITSDQLNHEVIKPSLESWSHDILPFRHTNIVQETGFFKKMLSIVKGARKDGGATSKST